MEAQYVSFFAWSYTSIKACDCFRHFFNDSKFHNKWQIEIVILYFKFVELFNKIFSLIVENDHGKFFRNTCSAINFLLEGHRGI